MKRTAILASVLVLSLAACKKKEEGASAKPTDQPAVPTQPAAPPPPFTGKLTVERVLGAKGLVDGLKPWASSLATLKGQLGEPTRVKGDKYEWAIVEGDDCAYLYVTKEDGAKYQATGEVVGSVMTPMKVGKDGPSGNRSECLEITGVTAGPPEDPNAAPPPSDGTPVAAADFAASAINGRSKWKGQQVSVAGVLGNPSTSTSGTDSWTTVAVKITADDTGKPVACSLTKNAPTPTLAAGTNVIVTGTVKISEWTAMSSGETKLEASLSDCTIAAAK